MFTLAKLVQVGLLRAWELPDGSLAYRNFYYTPKWLEEFNMLPDAPARGKSRPATVKERHAGLINQFVSGRPKSRLVRPQGDGMFPVFQRMKAPNKAIVEMRTTDARTFGCMGPRDTFVAMAVDTKQNLLLVSEDGRDGYALRAETCQKVRARIRADELDIVSECDDIIID